MNIKSTLRVIVCAFFVNIAVNAQNSPGLKTVIPPSPNASALGKYGEVPVGYYTGIPSISVPLASLRSRELNVPVSISYHAGGIRVEEVASWVGLGWSLSAGGVITRSVRGLPDDVLNGYFSTHANMHALGYAYKDYVGIPHYFQEGAGNGRQEDRNMYEQILIQVTDSEPDIFYFNFGGLSGKFYMNSSGNFVVSPVQTIKIEVTHTTSVTRWTLTTPDGVKYIFGTSLDQSRSALEKTSNEATVAAATSAWYLMEIVSPVNDRIDLFYTAENYSYQLKASETINRVVEDGGNCTLPEFDKKIMTNNFEGWRINRIQGCNGDIIFNQATTQRNDLPGSYALESLHIRDASASILKKIVLSTSYFNASGNCPTGPGYCKRLRLDGVEEVSGDGQDHGAKHSFEYSSIQLPSWDPNATSMNSQDMWGFYNGMVNSVLPRGGTINHSFGPSQVVFGADRHSDEYYMQACILNKIVYPTGGHSIFDYEANRLYTTDQALGGTNLEPVSKATDLILQTGETKSQDFVISDPDLSTGMVRITVKNRQQVENCPAGSCFQTYVEGRNSTAFSRYYFPEGASTVDLYPGEYRIGGSTFPGFESTISANPKIYYLNLSWLQYPTSTSFTVPGDKTIGGLRIKRITNFSDGTGVNIKRYKYNKFSAVDESSAVATNIVPLNADSFISAIWDSNSNTESDCSYVQCKSSTLIPLTPTSGSVVGYANVTELIGENGEAGKTEYTFTTALDYPDENKNFRPFPPAASYDYKRGLLLKKTSFSKTQSAYVKVEEVENLYSFGSSINETYGLSVSKDYYGPSNLTSVINFYVSGYKTPSEFFFLQTEKHRRYDQNSPANFVENAKTFEYGIATGHYQLIRTNETGSDGSVREIFSQYPPDLTLSGDAETARQNLLNSFNLRPVLQQTVIHKTVLDNETQITKTKTNFKTFHNGVTLPNTIELQNGTSPIETRMSLSNYDDFGNILEQSKTNDYKCSYQWAYNKSLPVAEVLNASNSKTVTNQISSMPTNFGGAPGVSATYDFVVGYTGTVTLSLGVAGNPAYSTVATISGMTSDSQTIQKGACGLTAFTFTNVSPGAKTLTITLTTPDPGIASLGVCGQLQYPGTIITEVKEFYLENFEENASAIADASAAHTGRKYWSGDFTVTYPKPNAKPYIIEYWYRNLGVWQYATAPYSGIVTLTDGDAIDDVRIYPVDARMKSYTYEPLLGITSVIDENGRATYYEYDKLGRLARIKNEKGGIEKQYTYNYKQ
jgi:YD repeat-containing protein